MAWQLRFSRARETAQATVGHRAIAVIMLATGLLIAGCGGSGSESGAGSRTVAVDEAQQQAADYRGPGQIEQSTYRSSSPAEGSLDYRLYIPTRYERLGPAPLIVVLHGCNTTAEQMMSSSALHPTAEREGIVLLYPDVPPSSQPTKCWNWFDPNSQVRDSGQAALIAGLTRDLMSRYRIDPERVYLLGMSSGAMMTSILGATYPDLFVAIGENAGCAYRAGPQCLGVGAVLPSEALGKQAYEAMGAYARVMPVLQLRGDADHTVPMSNSAQVTAQWTVTNNYVLAQAATGPFVTVPAEIVDGQKPDGYAWTRQRYRDAAGCLLIEDWVIHGMGHYFSGGSSDPTQSGNTDPKGPMMAEIAWRFFNRFRLSDFSHGYHPGGAACES